MSVIENKMATPNTLLAGIEAGGTKYVCAVADGSGNLIEEIRFPTGEPAATIAEAVDFFQRIHAEHGSISGMGIGTFGPADVDCESEWFGQILTTPKPGWAGFNIVTALREGLGADFPIAFETDVNAAAIGEAAFGAGRGKANVCYITVGTGIGGGFLHNGEPLHGRMHPEIGHLLIPDFEADFDSPNPGNVCPFHANCLEGFASGTAISKRWAVAGHELANDHAAWGLEAKYLAHGAVNLTAAWSPDVIIIGGGVIQQKSLIDKVRSEFLVLAGDYWDALPPVDEYLVLPELAQQAGIVGALEMARRLVF